MTTSIISKVVELDNCNKDLLIKALYTAEFWEIVNPSKQMEAKFISPNVLYTKVIDQIVNIPVKMEGNPLPRLFIVLNLSEMRRSIR